MNFIITLALGALAGYLAGNIMKTSNSWIMNIILGLVGGVVGSVVLGLIGISGSGLIGGTLVSIFGACLLIWVFGKLKK